LGGIEITNPSQFFGVIPFGIKPLEDNDLVALNTGGFVDGPRVETFEAEIAFCSGHKECLRLMDHIKTSKIEIPSIHDIKGSWFEDQLIEDGHIVNLSMSNDDNGRNASAQIQEGV